jgi:hypothetical protein
MGLLPLDFESSAYTNFATQARTLDIKTLLARRQEEPRLFGVAATKFKERLTENKSIANASLFMVKFFLPE